MKRGPALRALSSEHHSGLVLARHIRKACASPEFQPAATCAELIERFERELAPHFRKEEQGLLPALRAVGEHSLVERTLQEHRALRDMVMEADPENLPRFAQLLSDHIRFEEKELFELAQRRLSADQLAAMASRPAPKR